MAGVPELELTDPRVLTRHEDARAMLADQRFELRAESQRLDVPEDCRPYLRTMSEQPGPEHARLRQLVAPAFSARRAAGLADRIELLVDRLLDELPDHVEDGTVDLVEHVLRPLPMDVICELVGIPWADRPRWREYGVMVASGAGQQFAEAVPGIVHGVRDAVAWRRADPDVPDLLGDLVRARAEDGDRLDDTELITMVWHLVLAGQTPANLIANAVAERTPEAVGRPPRRADRAANRRRRVGQVVRSDVVDDSAVRDTGRRAVRQHDRQGRCGDRGGGRCEPGSTRVRRSRPVRRRAYGRTIGTPRLRTRPTLLSGRRVGPDRDRDRAGEIVGPVPRSGAGVRTRHS